ncbi:uncharacterized protein LOC133697670 [Populus nigra]|uniref:uncharacterized protein LOC133697670 n=1 Tax=Populus nigra TaxID=3691 RepID=UPI002B27A8E7|nr:uncharacterized protein LOC133697670 [Populus nigra]
MRSVEESESMTGNSSASSAIDFPTLCHRLKLKRSKSYGRSMKTMLPWRPTLSKTLTKFEFLNDAIKKQVEMILRALEYEMGGLSDEFKCSASKEFSFDVMFSQNMGRCWMSVSFQQQENFKL